MHIADDKAQNVKMAHTNGPEVSEKLARWAYSCEFC